jgi:choline dehydrogenase-like flavoprotein
MAERFDVVVVGSGAGGGVIAGELAERGLAVLLLEAGQHLTAADFSRWEARATHELWWPFSEALPARADGEGVTLFRGRCVGGGTTINTKVGLRAHASDYEKWFAASGLLGAGGEPFSATDLLPHYERVEARLGIRERGDWLPFVADTERGFEALGASLSPVRSYTDANCMRCGSCLQGCPTNAGKSTLNTYIHDAWALGKLELRAECEVRRVVIEDRGSGPEASGVEYLGADGAAHLVEAGAVVVACGTLATPGLLLRSGVPAAAGGSPSSRQIGRNLGFHPSRLVMGLFDNVQDAHRAYPITAHCMDFQTDDAGGFVIESATIMDPIGFATSVRGEDSAPLWGDGLVEVMDDYRHWTGLLAMVNDENNGVIDLAEDGSDRFTADFNERERERIASARDFSADVLRAAGAKRVLRTDLFTTHVQGSCRMGSDPARSALDANCESHDVRRLFVGDGSVVPRTLSVNPSLTFMALADRLAGYLARGEHGYFQGAS